MSKPLSLSSALPISSAHEAFRTLEPRHTREPHSARHTSHPRESSSADRVVQPLVRALSRGAEPSGLPTRARRAESDFTPAPGRMPLRLDAALPFHTPVAPRAAVAAPQVRAPQTLGPDVPAAKLGATLLADKSGTHFGLWAPNAQKVFVGGEFNNWGMTELKRDNNGNFLGDVAGAKAGQQYKFFVVGADGKGAWKNDPRSAQLTPANAQGPHGELGNSVIHDPDAYAWGDAGFKAAPLNKQILYELHVGTFNAKDGKTGTWNSAVEKLDRLKDLGINTVEVMPPEEFKGDKNWGYDPDAPFAPESAYGSPEDMKRFVDEAHKRGIAVVMDWVPNHMSADDGDVLKNVDGSSLGRDGIYFYTDGREDTGFGPRPDYGRPEVRKYWEDNATNWLDEYHIDGLRVDSTVTVRRDKNGAPIDDGFKLLQTVAEDVHARGKIYIGEDLQNDERITSPTSKGGAGFDSQWDPGYFYYPLRDVISQSDDRNRNMGRVVEALTQRYNGDPSQRVIFMENHDVSGHPGENNQTRIPDIISPNSPEDYYARKRSTLAAAVMLTSPGVPLEFQGEEMLDTNAFTFDNTPNLDWSREQKFSGIRDMYKDLNHLRLNTDGNTAGLSGANVKILQQNDDAKVVAYKRWDKGGAGDDTIVITNFSNTPLNAYSVGLPEGGNWKVRFNGDLSKYSPDFKNTGASQQVVTAQGQGLNGEPFKGSVSVGPYSVIILSKDKGT